MQRVDYLHGLVGVDVAVPGETEGTERVAAHVGALHGKEQPPAVAEDRVFRHGLYSRPGGVWFVPSIRRGHCTASFAFLRAAACQSQRRAYAQRCGGDSRYFHCPHLSQR